MGLLDRIAGVNASNTFVEVNVYFHTSEVRVVWMDNKLSPFATQIGSAYFESNRLFMFDRMYLAALFYGTMLRQLKPSPEDQEHAYMWLAWSADELQKNGNRAEPWKNVHFVKTSSLPLTDHYRTILYQGRRGNLMNRDYTIKATAAGGYAAAMMFIADIGRSGNDQEARFFGDWLMGMVKFYQHTSPNSLASEMPATANGMKYAVEQTTKKFAHDLGIEPPSF